MVVALVSSAGTLSVQLTIWHVSPGGLAQCMGALNGWEHLVSHDLISDITLVLYAR